MRDNMRIWCIIVMLIYCGITTAQKTISRKSVFYIGLWPKVSTNGKDAEYYTNNFSFNLIYANSTNEYGLGISGLIADVGNNASGIQIAGLGLNVEQMNGISVAFLNSAKIHNGIQFSICYNSSDILHGIQIGGFNFTEKTSGIQIGFSNNTNNLTNVQFGFENQAKIVSGLQIGIINFAEQNDYPIGFINIIKNGEKGVSLTFDEMRNFTVGFRSGGRVLYGIIGLGISFIESNTRNVLESGLGAHINISRSIRINTELAYSGISKWGPVTTTYGNEKPPSKPPDYEALTINRSSFRILPAFKAGKINIFAGVSINYMQSSHIENQRLFPHKHLWRNWTSVSLQQLYFGFMSGVQYCF